MTQLSLFTEPGDDLAPPPQDSGAEEATVVSADLTYTPADLSSFRFTVIEELTNPSAPPGADPPLVARGTQVRMVIPDPRSPKKLATIKVTAYQRDEPNLTTLARALVDLAREQLEDERAA